MIMSYKLSRFQFHVSIAEVEFDEAEFVERVS